ncbi:hypothetical protein [Hydrotalea sandarakina]|jgi:hypothetical protein|uniref:Uncharacterized protein n=1 Tax=Hydrotalea sandarakina TaxID=1004304 RepID=A0A2W7RJD6_9BACT|nr:hypothetical protein [Hydrotalea sandarakina]PZX60923.1 hypothetical protein LX80_02407 [Hydrotalea sandarakina]
MGKLTATIGIILECSKNLSKPKLANPKSLSEDRVFINLVTETYNYLKFIAVILKEKKLKQSLVLSNLSELRDRNLPYAEQMEIIDDIFKSQVSQRLEKYLKTHEALWISLQLRYEPLSQEILTTECAEVFSKLHESKMQNRNTVFSTSTEDVAVGYLDDGYGCGWRYSLCVAAATATAILCHASCETTALATTAGLGIPACVALCGTAQVAAGVYCYDKYCK